MFVAAVLDLAAVWGCDEHTEMYFLGIIFLFIKVMHSLDHQRINILEPVLHRIINQNQIRSNPLTPHNSTINPTCKIITSIVSKQLIHTNIEHSSIDSRHRVCDIQK